MADFSLLQTPDFARSALGGYAAGVQMRTQKVREAALQAYAKNPDAGVAAALKGGDFELAKQMEDRQLATEKRNALRDIFKQNPTASMQAESVGTPTAAQGGAVAPSVATAPVASSGAPQIDQEAFARLYAVDPQSAISLQKSIADMDKSQREAAGKRFEALGGVATWLLSLPYEQRRAGLQQAAGDLQALGFTPDQLNAFDPSNDNLNRIMAQAIGAKGMVDFRNDERKFQADQDYRRESLDIQRQGLGVRQGALSLAQRREGRIAAGGGGGSTGLSDMSDDALIAALRGE